MRIEIDGEADVITVDGLRISLDVLRVLANPDVKQTYRFERQGDSTTVTVVTRGMTMINGHPNGDPMNDPPSLR